jgi:hypothetical protein
MIKVLIREVCCSATRKKMTLVFQFVTPKIPGVSIGIPAAGMPKLGAAAILLL